MRAATDSPAIPHSSDPVNVTMWRLEKGGTRWQMQTDDPAIARKMSRKAGFKLVASGFNCFLRVFSFNASRPEVARRIFTRVCNQTPKLDRVTGLYRPDLDAPPVAPVRRKRLPEFDKLGAEVAA